MEAYLMSWRSFAKMNDAKYQIFSSINSNEYNNKMSNSQGDVKEKIESNESDTNSLPIHCIVQAISSTEDLKATSCRSCDGKPRLSSENWWECNCKSTDVSGCVVVPENTSMSDLVKTVLLKLGYPNCASSFAAGSILIRNWEPLPLETVCPEMKKTVGDILGELTAVISLRIQIFRPKITTLQKIKDNLLSFLIRTNEKFLRDSDCPFDTYTLSEFCEQSNHTAKSQMVQEPSEDLQGKFEAWLKFQEKTRAGLENGKSESPSGSFVPSNTSITDNNICNGNAHDVVNGNAKSVPQRPESVRSETSGKSVEECGKGEENVDPVKESTSATVTERPRAFAPPKTRVRTSFDPEFELPKLHKWYLENPHPSRQQIYEYVAELNSLESRKGRKQLDINNVVYWFKNARAAQKRTECRRFFNSPPSGINRCKVLKIPLGKTSGVPSDDPKVISDDEASITSESGDDYRNGNANGRCLQVVGKWNSNGQGEAVLEMQIAARKNEFVQSIVETKKDETNDNEETSRSAILSGDDDSTDPIAKNPVSKEENSPRETPERNIHQKENQGVSSKEIKKLETGESETPENGERRNGSGGGVKDKELSPSKVSIRNSFLPYKENSSINNGAFLPPYKSAFPVPPNSILGHSFICMSQYINPKPNALPLSSDERRKRNRTFIDPVTEVPRLEQWFRVSTHPSHSLIVRYTEELNNMPYRRKFPKLETKNVQFWFKNRRAKNKRLNYLETNN